MLLLLLVLSALAYLLQLLFLRAGLTRADAFAPRQGYQPTVSVIVAARNEEAVLAECLASLGRLDYPADKLELIIVDDGSTDGTRAIIESFRSRDPRLKAVSTEPSGGNLRGKTNAVARGIGVSTGEILMFTDADCTVPATWVRETVESFDERTGIVGGFTVLGADGALAGMQTLDWIFLFGIASATAGWKIPLTAVGTNLSVRRRAYDATGGYHAIPFSVTEDYALVQAVLTRTGYGMRFPLKPGCVVRSRACSGWLQLYRQKQRWGVGGLDMVPRGVAFMAVGWAAKALALIGMVAGSAIPSLLLFLLMAAGELLFMWRPLRTFDALPFLRYFPAFELYFAFYVLLLPPVAYLSRNVVWKERVLTDRL